MGGGRVMGFGGGTMMQRGMSIRLAPGDACYRCNMVTYADEDVPFEHKHIISHSAGSIEGRESDELVTMLFDHPDFRPLAEQAGIPRIEFAGEFDRADQHAATAADFTWVQDLGIAGFPTLLAERNGQLALLTNGYQPLEVLAPLLGRWLERAACA